MDGIGFTGSDVRECNIQERYQAGHVLGLGLPQAHMEVRASLALFESTLKSLNVPKLLRDGTPSPKASKPGPQALQPAVGVGARTSLGASSGAGGLGGARLAPAHPSKEDLVGLVQPLPLGAAAGGDKRQAMAAGPYPAMSGMGEDVPPAFGECGHWVAAALQRF
jgi:hypothetical protein